MRARLPGASRVAATLAAAVLGCAACGASSTNVKAVGPSYEVATASVGSLGHVLVNGRGYTLYLYVPDAHSSRSTCNGVCTVGWPPLLLPRSVTSPVAGPGIQSTLLGVTRRSDGTTQITYAGWPLYRWSNDTSPGQATGQNLYNLGGKWYVVGPDGNPVR